MTLAFGHLPARCFHVVAELGVADALDEDPVSADSLAAACGADADALARMLRLLASHGVFEERDGGYVHTSVSRLLRTDHPRSMRAFARMIGSSWNWASFGALEHSARTGEPSIDTVVPGGMWAHFADHPEDGAIFNDAMVAKSHGDIEAVLAAYDFSGFTTIADIGGGSGHWLKAILASAPNATGVLFDQPHVVAEAPAIERVQARGGDFFKDELPECDAYILSNIIHDWADPEATAILQAVRRAAPGGARVLVVEMLVPDEPGQHLSKVLDVMMLASVGGRERTQAEYESLFSRAGLRLERVVTTLSPYCVIEAVPA